MMPPAPMSIATGLLCRQSLLDSYFPQQLLFVMQALQVIIAQSQAGLDWLIRRLHARREILKEVEAAPHVALQSKAARHRAILTVPCPLRALQ